MTIFDEMKNGIILNELSKQQQFIKNEFIKLEKEYTKQFKQLRENIIEENIGFEGHIAQNKLEYFHVKESQFKQDFMKINGIKSDYATKDMPFDNVNGFNGKFEYDTQGYLTKLLIGSHCIDPIFQKQCQKYFETLNKQHGIKCKYSSAPVKTRQRSVVKSKIDYNHRAYPTTSHILDFVRCSVTFDNIEHLLNGFNKFYHTFHYTNMSKETEIQLLNLKMAQKFGINPGHVKINDSSKKEFDCIKGIVRVKNDFTKLTLNNNGKIEDLPLKSFDYCDIKCNVLIEYYNIKIIGEIQFLLSFMLDAKKMSHKTYSFLRKEELYRKLYQLSQFDENSLLNKLSKIILSHNINQLSKFFETMSLKEKYFVLKNENVIVNILKENKWKKGEKLLQLVLKTTKIKLML